ncbi:MAG: hypothetical protein KAY65_05180 [Planctomycetes bacterium]|nr:hypothetical protein [Planctomycetota bacterium]
MSKRVLFLAAIGLLFAAPNLQAVQINSSWIAGDPNAWGNPNNWNPPIVPDNDGDTFAVTISSSERTRVKFNQSRTIDRLSCYGDVDLEIGENDLSLTSPDGLTNYGTLDISGSGVEHEIKGNVTNANGGHIFLTYWLEIKGQFINNGNVSVFPGGRLRVENGSLVNSGDFLLYNALVGTNGILENTSDGVIRGTGLIYSDLSFQNQGLVYAYGGPLMVGTRGSFVNSGTITNAPLSSLSLAHDGPPEDVNNQGTIEVSAGGGVTFDCNLVNEPNGTIELLGGTLAATTITQTAGANFAGFGGIAGDVIIESNGQIKLTGPTSIVADVEIRENATLEISDGTTLVTGRTTCNGTIHLKGGRIIPQGGLSGDCSIIWQPGLYTNIADFNLDGKVNIKDFALFADTWLWQTSWY